VFGSVVAIAFQSVFHLKMHQNNICLFLKIIFNINTLKLYIYIYIYIYNFLKKSKFHGEEILELWKMSKMLLRNLSRYSRKLQKMSLSLQKIKKYM